MSVCAFMFCEHFKWPATLTVLWCTFLVQLSLVNDVTVLTIVIYCFHMPTNPGLYYINCWNLNCYIPLTTSKSKFSHSTDMLCNLHWLPVQYRIQFKLALLAFNTRSNNAPLYMSCLHVLHVPGRSLRSSQSNLLCVPSHKLNFGARSFHVAAPTVWNSLPADIHACTFNGSFIRQLKTFCFNNAF